MLYPIFFTVFRVYFVLLALLSLGGTVWVVRTRPSRSDKKLAVLANVLFVGVVVFFALIVVTAILREHNL